MSFIVGLVVMKSALMQTLLVCCPESQQFWCHVATRHILNMDLIFLVLRTSTSLQRSVHVTQFLPSLLKYQNQKS